MDIFERKYENIYLTLRVGLMTSMEAFIRLSSYVNIADLRKIIKNIYDILMLNKIYTQKQKPKNYIEKMQ